MKEVSPYVSIVARSMPDDDAIAVYLSSIGEGAFSNKRDFYEPSDLVEFAGRLARRSGQPEPGSIRDILRRGEAVSLRHITWTFILQDVSEPLARELKRHGGVVTQEPAGHAGLTDIPMWFPTWALEDAELMAKARLLLWQMELLQEWMAGHFGLDEPEAGFVTEVDKASFMRRLIPAGAAVSVLWTADARTLRHAIENCTRPAADLEARLVFSSIAGLLIADSPLLFGDFTEQQDGSWKPEWSKV